VRREPIDVAPIPDDRKPRTDRTLVLGEVPLDHLLKSIEESFSARLVPANLKAAEAGFARVE
jgi:hypothetical protein